MMPDSTKPDPFGLKQYIESSVKQSEKSRREYSLFGHVYVYVQDFLPESVEIVSVLEIIENTIPAHLANEIDTIFIGDYQELKSRSMTAMYDSGAIYVSNEQDDESDMVDDIVHEIAHSLEQPYGWHIYSDEILEKEFLKKRIQAYDVLWAHEYVEKKHYNYFTNVEYSKEFDEFLYKAVGYDKLTHLLMGIFTTPYAATSLREYFATGIEDYFINDRAYLKRTCPRLFTKIDKLTKGEYDE
jgi:hypothetical protein